MRIDRSLDIADFHRAGTRAGDDPGIRGHDDFVADADVSAEASIVEPSHLERVARKPYGRVGLDRGDVSSAPGALRQKNDRRTWILPIIVTSRPLPVDTLIEPLPVLTSSVVPSGTVTLVSNVPSAARLSVVARLTSSSVDRAMNFVGILVFMWGAPDSCRVYPL